MRLHLVVSAGLVSLCFALTGLPQARQTPRPARPAASRSAGPAYMQKLKHFEENQVATKAVLKNGLTVIVQEFRTYPVASLSTYVTAGYSDEGSETSGISEVIARMFYRGTASRAPNVIPREIKAMGGSVKCEASYDHSRYELVVPSAQWKKGLEIQADALLNPLMDADELKKAIELTLGQVRAEADAPEKFSRDKLVEFAFGQRLSGRRFADRDGSLRDLDRQKVLDYYRNHFSAPQVILVVSGDVNAADVLNEVVRLYERASASPGRLDNSARTERNSGFHYGEFRGPTANALVTFGFPTAPVESSEFPGLEVLRALVGSGMASIINRRLAAKTEGILSGAAELLDLPGAGYFLIRLNVDPRNIDRSEIGLLTELELLKHDEPAADDLERAQAQLEREYWSRLETASGRARMLADFESQGDWKRSSQYLARIRAVKASDIPKIAGKYLMLDRSSLVEFLPNGSEPRNLLPETVSKTLQELLPSAVDQAEAEREKETVPAVAMPAPPSGFKPSEVRYSMQKASILRGPELYIREDHNLPLIHLGLFYSGGRLQETKENSGITALMLRSMLRGSKDKPGPLLFRQLELFGGDLIPVVDRDYFGVRISVLSRNIEPTLELLKDIFLAPAFDDDEFALQKSTQLEATKVGKFPSEKGASGLLQAALFDDHPYGLDPFGTQSAADQLTLKAVKDWYASTVHNRKPMVVIIGDTQGTSLASFFVKNFSGSRFVDSKTPATSPKPPGGAGNVEMNCDRCESLVLLGFQAPPEGDEDSYATLVLRSLLRGEGGRLDDRLKGVQALAYAVDFDYDRGVRGGCVVARLATSQINEESAIKSLQAELHRIMDDPIPYRDYRAAVNAALGEYWVSQQNRFSQIEALVRSLESGHGLEGVLEFPGRIQDVRQDELIEVARRILNFDKSIMIRVHGKPGL